MNLSLTSIARRRGVALLWLAAVLLLSAHFALNLQLVGKPFLDAGAYADYHEKRPYQYRLLMAPVMGALMDVLAQPAARSLLVRLPGYLGTPEAAAYVVVNASAFALSLLLMAALAAKALHGDAVQRAALALYVALVYLYLCLNPNVAFILPYDMPALALAQACLLCILDRRWAWLYPLFALATLNRETSFLVVVFLAAKALLDRPWKPSLLIHAGALSLLWLAIKVGLYFKFSALPSDEGFRVAHNLASLLKPWQWPALLPLLASFGLTLASLRHAATQREWALTGCIGFAAIFVVGQLTETRAFADLISYFTIAIAQWLAVRRRPAAGVQNPE